MIVAKLERICEKDANVDSSDEGMQCGVDVDAKASPEARKDLQFT